MKLVDEFFESEGIQRIPWPEKSLDFYPIEILWDYFRRTTASRYSPPRKIKALKMALLEERSFISQTVVNNVITT